MVDQTVTLEEQAKRLACLEAICSSMASDIMNARDVLRDNAESPAAAYLVAEALGRFGWMAERAAHLAGRKVPGTASSGSSDDADGWLLDASAQGAIGDLVHPEVQHA